MTEPVDPVSGLVPELVPGETDSAEAIKQALRDSRKKIKPWMRIELAHHLATKDITRTRMAKLYGVTTGYITQWAKLNARMIDEIRDDLDNQYASLWIASKMRRIEALQADYEETLDHKNAGHFEWVRARKEIARAVAEELGDLPMRQQQVAVGGVVRFELVGVDMDECFPPAKSDEDPGDPV
jgi:predicted transcriptional regulator